eukprot:scaffold30149_cov39-Phaeocystis_antarctica.AAC.3
MSGLGLAAHLSGSCAGWWHNQQPSQGSANGARPRIGEFAIRGPNPTFWRVRGRAPPRADWDTSGC